MADASELILKEITTNQDVNWLVPHQAIEELLMLPENEFRRI
jgi:hypothetical protein